MGPPQPVPRFAHRSPDVQPRQQKDEYLVWLACHLVSVPLRSRTLTAQQWLPLVAKQVDTVTFLEPWLLCFIPAHLTLPPQFQEERPERLYLSHPGMYRGEVLEVKLLVTSGPLHFLLSLPISLSPQEKCILFILRCHQRGELTLKKTPSRHS